MVGAESRPMYVVGGMAEPVGQGTRRVGLPMWVFCSVLFLHLFILYICWGGTEPAFWFFPSVTFVPVIRLNIANCLPVQLSYWLLCVFFF